MKVILSDILQGEPLWPTYIIGQFAGSVLKKTRKGPNNCLKRFRWTVPYLTSIILCQLFLHPNNSSGFQYQCKNAKNEDFLICSIISTAVNLKVLWCFLVCYIVFSWHAMKSDSNHAIFNVRHCFAFFCINYPKLISICVMTNKMVLNERLSTFKHVHIIRVKFDKGSWYQMDIE